MVCTTAFGMGVDVSNIEIVLKVGCPSTLVELVQEFGRSGRDGRKAKGTYTCTAIGYLISILLYLQEFCCSMMTTYSIWHIGQRTSQLNNN